METNKYSTAAGFLAQYTSRKQNMENKNKVLNGTSKPPPPPGPPPAFARLSQQAANSANKNVNLNSNAAQATISQNEGLNLIPNEGFSAPCLEERHDALLQQLKKMKAMIAFGENERQQLMLERMQLLNEYQILEEKHRQSIAYLSRRENHIEHTDKTSITDIPFNEREEYLLQTISELQDSLKYCLDKRQEEVSPMTPSKISSERDALFLYARDLEVQISQEMVSKHLSILFLRLEKWRMLKLAGAFNRWIRNT